MFCLPFEYFGRNSRVDVVYSIEYGEHIVVVVFFFFVDWKLKILNVFWEYWTLFNNKINNGDDDGDDVEAKIFQYGIEWNSDKKRKMWVTFRININNLCVISKVIY